MQATKRPDLFRPVLSKNDWEKIYSAIEAYSHNVEYRELLDRLERQAKINGITQPAARHS